MTTQAAYLVLSWEYPVLSYVLLIHWINDAAPGRNPSRHWSSTGNSVEMPLGTLAAHTVNRRHDPGEERARAAQAEGVFILSCCVPSVRRRVCFTQESPDRGEES